MRINLAQSSNATDDASKKATASDSDGNSSEDETAKPSSNSSQVVDGADFAGEMPMVLEASFIRQEPAEAALDRGDGSSAAQARGTVIGGDSPSRIAYFAPATELDVACSEGMLRACNETIASLGSIVTSSATDPDPFVAQMQASSSTDESGKDVSQKVRWSMAPRALAEACAILRIAAFYGLASESPTAVVPVHPLFVEMTPPNGGKSPPMSCILPCSTLAQELILRRHFARVVPASSSHAGGSAGLASFAGEVLQRGV